MIFGLAGAVAGGGIGYLMFGVVGGMAGGILGALVGLSAGAVLRVAAAADMAETKNAKIENIVPSEQSDTGENAEHSDQEKK